MEIRKIGQAEVVDFNGVRYRRYPKSKNKSHRKYFKSSGNIDRKVSMLHRAVWIFYNGEIPVGFHVHHKDGDYKNNDISNLDCVEGKEHNSKHSKELLKDEKYLRKYKRHLGRIRPLATEWHKSKEGREKAKVIFENMPKVKKICFVCGCEFETTFISASRAKFCSRKCRMAHYKRYGISQYKRKSA